jgi:hypothetical protein
MGPESYNLSTLSHLDALLSCPLNPAAIAARRLVRTLIIHLADDEAGQTRWLQDALATKLYTNHLGPPIYQKYVRASSAAPTLRPPVSHHSRLPSSIIAQQVSCAHLPPLALM